MLVEPVRWPWLGPAQNYLHWYPGLREIVRDFQPDVIDLWEEPWALVSAQACGTRRRARPRAAVLCETEQNIEKQLPPPFESIRRRVLGEADFLIGRSREAVEVARRRGYTGQASVVPNGVDCTLFRPLDRAACRAELSIGQFTVGYVGRLVPEKGLSDLVAAAGMVERVGLLMIGDGPLRAELTARPGVRVVPGAPATELVRWMNAMDVLVLPSRTTPRWKEQFGRVLAEAGACATPVVGSDSGAIPDVVGDAGLIFPERDVRSLASTLRTLRDDTELRHRLGQAGRERAVKLFDWPRIAQAMAAIYHAMVNR